MEKKDLFLKIFQKKDRQPSIDNFDLHKTLRVRIVIIIESLLIEVVHKSYPFALHPNESPIQRYSHEYEEFVLNFTDGGDEIRCDYYILANVWLLLPKDEMEAETVQEIEE